MPRIKELHPLAGANDPRIVESFTRLFRSKNPDVSDSFIRSRVDRELKLIFTLQYMDRLLVIHPYDSRVFRSAEMLAIVNVDMLRGNSTEQDFRSWELGQYELLALPHLSGLESPFRDVHHARHFVVQLRGLALAEHARRSRIQAVGALELMVDLFDNRDAKQVLGHLYDEGDPAVRGAAEAALRRITDT